MNSALIELRAAIAVIHRAVTAATSADPAVVARAHQTLCRHHDRSPAQLATLDACLAAETRRQGPCALRAAVAALAHDLGLPARDATAYLAVQLQLFEP